MEPAFERAFPGTRKAVKRHVLSCALECFDERGFDAVTIDDIKAKSDSSTGTIYHHFGNKEGVATAIYLAALDDQQVGLEQAFEEFQDVRGVLEGWISVYINWVVDNPRLARFMFQSRRSIATGNTQDQLKARNDKRYGALQDFLREGVKAGEIRALPSETYASLIIGQSENYCRAWLSGRVKTSPIEHIDVFANAAWRSIALEQGI